MDNPEYSPYKRLYTAGGGIVARTPLPDGPVVLRSPTTAESTGRNSQSPEPARITHESHILTGRDANAIAIRSGTTILSTSSAPLRFQILHTHWSSHLRRAPPARDPTGPGPPEPQNPKARAPLARRRPNPTRRRAQNPNPYLASAIKACV